MKAINKVESHYTKEEFIKLMRDGIVQQFNLIENTIKDRPGAILIGLGMDSDDPLLLPCVIKSTDKISQYRNSYIQLYDVQRYAELIGFKNRLKIDTKDGRFDPVEKMAGIIVVAHVNSLELIEKIVN
jgi:hypothetical protein